MVMAPSSQEIAPQPVVKKLKLVEQMMRDQESEISQSPSALLQELEGYSQDKFRLDTTIDPIHYWTEKQQRAGSASALAMFACHYLSIPASSSFVESIFSYAGFSSEKLRNKISDQNLEREVFVKVNREFFQQ